MLRPVCGSARLKYSHPLFHYRARLVSADRSFRCTRIDRYEISKREGETVSLLHRSHRVQNKNCIHNWVHVHVGCFSVIPVASVTQIRTFQQGSTLGMLLPSLLLLLQGLEVFPGW